MISCLSNTDLLPVISRRRLFAIISSGEQTVYLIALMPTNPLTSSIETHDAIQKRLVGQPSWDYVPLNLYPSDAPHYKVNTLYLCTNLEALMFAGVNAEEISRPFLHHDG